MVYAGKEWQEYRRSLTYEDIEKTRPLTPEESYWKHFQNKTLLQKLDEFEKMSRDVEIMIS